MKQNKYDDPTFFERYCKMPRSVQGLSAAGEWHALKALLPDLTAKRVLDLGCGFGWHCAYAAEHGAASVVGVDLSARMLAEAERRNPSPRVRYQRAAIEDVDFPNASFDVALSSLALHYVADVNAVFQKVARILAPGGRFLFSVEHPVFTAEGRQDWDYGKDGEKRYWPVDRYFEEGARDAVFLGEHVVKYHRTLTSYVQGLLRHGFALEALVEPQPSEESLAALPEMREELRRPMMLLLSAVVV